MPVSTATPADLTPGDAFGDIFGDVFGDIFGGGRRSRSSVFRGADLRYEVDLELRQAVFGDTLNITLPTHVSCEACDGSGAKPGTSPVSCDDLRWPWTGTSAAGVLFRSANLSEL